MSASAINAASIPSLRTAWMPSGLPRNIAVNLSDSPNRSDLPAASRIKAVVSGAIMEVGDHRGGDRQRDFGRADRADIEPRGGVGAVEIGFAETRRRQPLAQRGVAAARSQRGDITGRRG